MTPQERALVDGLFDRLARLETNPRDPEAERAIIDGLRRAPNAVYALVQTALVQDEALKRADARIRELTGEEPPHEESRGFLDQMRDALMGGGGTGGRASVPSVGAGGGPDPRWNRGGAYPGDQGGGFQGGPGYAPGGGYGNPGTRAAPGLGGGSFLGTAAASAAGMIGGALLLNSISSMFGHHGGSAFASTPDAARGSPWDNGAAGSDLARDAGLNDIGAGSQAGEAQSAGLFDSNDDAGFDGGDDIGGDFDGGGDTA